MVVVELCYLCLQLLLCLIDKFSSCISLMVRVFFLLMMMMMQERLYVPKIVCLKSSLMTVKKITDFSFAWMDNLMEISMVLNSHLKMVTKSVFLMEKRLDNLMETAKVSNSHL